MASSPKAKTTTSSWPRSFETSAGQDILIEPKDEGFNRLGWLFPYAVGGFGAVAGVFMVRKWSRRPPAVEATRFLRRRPPKTPPCTRASIASSKTSTNPLPPTSSTPDTLRPWQFFTLGALVCATAAVFVIRGTTAENAHLRLPRHFCRRARRAGRPERPAPAGDGRDSTARHDRQPHACGARAREEPGAAIHQGARVRSRHGKDRGGRL